ncbi:MAG: hypothetical protein A2X56_03885 [Nitrospirae bacterium GWC2_57_13]|nr:MAG: hypothetical protein A2X56_03885 [Nitrospirae bacterium GWC2_57_13]
MWNNYQAHQETEEKARVEARTIFEHNIAYRRWNTMLGGVYAPISDTNPPNPYLVHPNREKRTIDGTALTLINPFRMTRQAYALLKEQSPLASINRTVSLKPLNPENDPDPWERKALLSFVDETTEVSERTTIGGVPYMRIMKPYITVQGCLKCHGMQGYKVGDIRGGMSIAVPMAPYLQGAARTQKTIVVSHMLLWVFGIAGIMLFARGVRSREEKIAESEWKFRTLSEFAYDWEYWIDEQKKLVFMSPSCAHITGYTQEEFMGDPGLLFSIIHPEDREKFRKHMEKFRSPQHEEMEVRITTKGGQVKWLSHGCEHISVGDSFLGRRVSNRDITDRKNLEEQLHQSQKMESLGMLAGGIAHDFNNLLTAVSGYASMLQKKLTNIDDVSRTYIDHVLTATKQAKSLTSNLLAFSRRQKLRPGMVSMQSVVDDIAVLIKRLIGEDIELTATTTGIEFPVEADRHQIEQVLMNLVTNARDAMPSGGAMTIRSNPVVLGAEFAGQYGAQAGNYMMLTVSDTGCGIDEEDLQRIFEPFYTSKEKGKGTGLGLSIIYNIVKQHRGFITTESRPGRGATFKIYLPAAHRDEQGKDLSMISVTKKPEEYRGHETVLVAEDDLVVRIFLKDILREHGYGVVLAEDGVEAIERYREHRKDISLAIIDMVMPRKSGREVCEFIRNSGRDCKIILISGYTRDMLADKGVSDAGFEFFQKPLEIDSLLRVMRSMLDAGAETTQSR